MYIFAVNLLHEFRNMLVINLFELLNNVHVSVLIFFQAYAAVILPS